MNSRKLIFWISILSLMVPAARLQAEEFSIEARGTLFFPSDPAFRDIYGKGMSWGGELTLRLSRSLSVWAGADYFSKTGRLVAAEEETNIRLVPLVLGVRCDLLVSNLRPYVGLAAGYFQYKEQNSLGRIKKGALGLLGRAGLLINTGSAIFIDIQGSWSTCRVQPMDISANLGGFQAGLGLGFDF